RKKLQMNVKAIHMIFCALSPNEYNRVSSYDLTKEMWDRLKVTYEGSNQEYELFKMLDDESITRMYTRFNIRNALNSLGKSYTNNKMVRKILRKVQKVSFPKKQNQKKPFKKTPKTKEEEPKKLEEVTCYEYNKTRHYKSDCPGLKKKKEYFKKKRATIAT
ncbi:LOW QUALITY PROTEIN: UBN2 domain-containing protein, partial [Cephalotus follicularis]